MFRSLILLAALAGTAAHAQSIYTWVDSQGVTHYTNDRGALPRGNKKVRITRGKPLGELKFHPVRGAPEDTEVKPAEAPAPAPASAPSAAITEEAQQASALERQWRAAFERARERIRDLEQQAATEPKAQPMLQRARAELDDLERLAAVRAVPREWRRAKN
jgi:hypothetical protein